MGWAAPDHKQLTTKVASFSTEIFSWDLDLLASNFRWVECHRKVIIYICSWRLGETTQRAEYTQDAKIVRNSPPATKYRSAYCLISDPYQVGDLAVSIARRLPDPSMPSEFDGVDLVVVWLMYLMNAFIWCMWRKYISGFYKSFSL